MRGPDSLRAPTRWYAEYSEKREEKNVDMMKNQTLIRKA